MKRTQDRPEPGKQYRLTGGFGVASIAAGNSWAESKVRHCNFCNRPEGSHTLLCPIGLEELGILEEHIAEEEAEAIDRAYDEWKDEMMWRDSPPGDDE